MPPLIQEFTGVENYKGRAKQREEIMKHITAENYRDMCMRVSKMDDSDTEIGSSNFGRFLKFLEEADIGWIGEINESLE